MNTQQEYEYFDGEGKICQGDEEYLNTFNKTWVNTSHNVGDHLEPGYKYRRPINFFSKEYQAELAKQWVLEGFERDVLLPHKNTWDSNLSRTKWDRFSIYRRKLQPTQEQLDAQAAKEYSKTATIQPDTTVIEQAYLEGIKRERNRNK